MKINLPVTDKENDFPDSMRIVSTTGLKGVLEYANQDFLQISGFTQEEIKGQAHNIVRHPDMPQAAFQDLWDNIKLGKSWMGIVKNRCKNGDYYWVDAFVTPVKKNNQMVGYQSVRLKPTKKIVESAEKLYQDLNKGTPFWKSIISKLKFGVMGNITIVSTLTGLSGFVFSKVISKFLVLDSIWVSLSTVGAIVAVAVVLSKWIATPWQKAAEESKTIFSNGLAQQVYTERGDELGQLQLVIKMLQLQQETLVYRIGDAASNLENTSTSTAATSEQAFQEMSSQSEETEMVATAMNEMTATVQEVATNTSATADSTNNVKQEVENGQKIVINTVESITELASQIEDAVAAINKLAHSSEEIETVVEVIRGIAEQTNLLALNAAIEAARAGEQGRGFAVVADEVRTLASRTQGSTQEIQKIIEQLQITSEEAVKVMETCQVSAKESVAEAKNAGHSLESITNNVDTIMGMTTQIATASEEQSSVSEEINRNITNINDSTSQTKEASKSAMDSNKELVSEIQNLQQIVKQFGLG